VFEHCHEARSLWRHLWPVNGLFSSNASLILVNCYWSGLPWLFYPVVTTRNITHPSNPTKSRAKSSWYGYWTLVLMSKVDQGQSMISFRVIIKVIIHFSSLVMILWRKSFFQNFESKVSTVLRSRFLLSSDNSCGTHLPSFWIFIRKPPEMACCVTLSCCSSSFSICADFISSYACNSSVSNF